MGQSSRGVLSGRASSGNRSGPRGPAGIDGTATVVDQNAGRTISRVIGRQIQDRRGTLSYAAHAAERHDLRGRGTQGRSVGPDNAPRLRRVDETGADAVDADTVRRDLDGKRSRQTKQSRL